MFGEEDKIEHQYMRIGYPETEQWRTSICICIDMSIEEGHWRSDSLLQWALALAVGVGIGTMLALRLLLKSCDHVNIRKIKSYRLDVSLSSLYTGRFDHQEFSEYVNATIYQVLIGVYMDPRPMETAHLRQPLSKSTFG